MKAILTLEFDNSAELVDYVGRLGNATKSAVAATAPVAAKPAVAAPAPVAAKPAVAAPAPVVAKPAVAAPASAASEEDLLGGEVKIIDYDTLWANTSAKIQAGHREPVKAELARLNVARVSDLKPEQFNDFNEFVLAL